MIECKRRGNVGVSMLACYLCYSLGTPALRLHSEKNRGGYELQQN